MTAETETFEASAFMKKFFNNLAELKEFVKEKADETNDETLIEIYKRLDQTFKVEK